MSSFEDFVRRARLDLESYFIANNITSDEELVSYCKRNSIGLPTQRYFEKDIIKQKEVKKPTTKPKPKVEKKVEKKEPAPKKTRTTRSRSRKTTTKK